MQVDCFQDKMYQFYMRIPVRDSIAAFTPLTIQIERPTLSHWNREFFAWFVTTAID